MRCYPMAPSSKVVRKIRGGAIYSLEREKIEGWGCWRLSRSYCKYTPCSWAMINGRRLSCWQTPKRNETGLRSLQGEHCLSILRVYSNDPEREGKAHWRSLRPLPSRQGRCCRAT